MAIQLPDILAPKQPPLHPADMPMEEDVTVSEVQQPLPQEGIAAPSAQQAQGGVAPAAQGGILDQFTDTSGIGVSRRSPFNAQGLNTYNQKYRYTNEDFYGHRGPDITWTDPRGVQMYVPRAGELPLGLWASRMQAVQGDLAQTRKGIGDLMKDTGMPKTAAPYQADFTRLVTDAQQKYIDGIAAQYGGDTAMAYQEISTEGSPANLGWKRLMANADAIGQHVKGEWDQIGQWAKLLVEGKVNADPEMVQMAHEYLHGVGSLSGNSGIGDFEKAVKYIGRIRMEAGLDYFANQLGDKMMDEAYATVKNDLQRGISMGQRVIDEKTIKSVEDGIYKALVDRAVDYTPSIDSPEGRARAERYFRFRYPQVKELKKELRYVNLPDGGGSGASANNKAWVGEIEVGSSATSPWREGSTASGGNVERLPIGQIVSGRNEPMGVRRFTGKVDGKMQEVEMLPSYIERDGSGDFWISGLWVQQKTTTKEKAGEEDEDASSFGTSRPSAYGTTEEYIEKGPLRIRVAGNEERLRQYLGGLDWRSRFGESQKKQSPAPAKTATSGGVTWTKDPDETAIKQAFPGAWKDPTHGWVVKDEKGKTRKIKMN